MWLLRNEVKGLTFRIQPGKTNVVSRKDGDLLLVGDQSISRKHAEISVLHENKNEGIIFKDLGSKYGTFTQLGGGELTQASQNQPVTLNNGDTIRFGIQWNTWRVEYFPLVVATSTLNAGEKSEVKEVVAALGGEVTNDWQQCCTHLTMNKLTVTVKVVCALACGKPVVVPGYWKALKDSLESTETKLPDCKDFLPPLAEALLNPSEVSFAPNPDRGKLFSDYTFVAASVKQLSRIKPMVTSAGGNAVEFSAGSWPVSELMHDKIILMQHTAGDRQGSQQSQIPDGYIAAARKLKAAGVRCVPESEIGLSILYCSMAQYCNPRYSPQSLFGASSSENTQQITVPSNKKRALDNSNDEEQHPSKKTNSEDMFSSQAVEVESENSVNIPTTSKTRCGLREKRPIVNPSLDMFAPSGQISGQSNQSKNTISKAKSKSPENPSKAKKTIVNPSLDMFATSGQISGQTEHSRNTPNKEKTNSPENITNVRKSVVNPSLDMFAPSGRSNEENRNEVNPSCHDMFVSNESRTTLEKKKSNCNQSPVPNKQPRLAQIDDENDDFSFVTNKRTSKFQKTALESDDEDAFSFSSSRKSRRQHVVGQDCEDEFSFVSSKSSKKRNRQSDPDTLDSRVEYLSKTDKASRSNTKNNYIIPPNENEDENDDLFAFAGDPAPKRRKDNGHIQNEDEPDAEVKLALFSKNNNYSTGPPNSSEPILFEEPVDEKNLMTYSKDKSYPVKIKEEVKDEEVDELIKELYNATIVVVKPLVVIRQKPSEAQPTNNVKNFKKFRKVTAVNKGNVPRIIGGSDLVAHCATCQNIDDDLLPPSPPKMTLDDDWDFPNEKKKGRKR